MIPTRPVHETVAAFCELTWRAEAHHELRETRRGEADAVVLPASVAIPAAASGPEEGCAASAAAAETFS